MRPSGSRRRVLALSSASAALRPSLADSETATCGCCDRLVGSNGKMEKTVLILAFLSYWCSIQALFTVEIAKLVYVAEYGSTVNMTCTFPEADSLRMKDLKVYWHQMSSSQMIVKEIYTLDGGKENLTLQDVSYRGRATLLTDKLYKGQAVLQISNVKLTDAGTYRCLIIYGGADHKQTTLQVKVPFRKINTSVSGQEERELICQSKGYPKPEILWQNERQDLSDKASTSYRINAEQLYDVITVLRVNTTVNTTYRCIFWNKELQENTSESFSFSGHCRKHATFCKDGKNSLGCFVCRRNTSSHIWKSIQNFCLHFSHSTDKRITSEYRIKIPLKRELKMPLSMDVTETTEIIHIPSEENRAYLPITTMNDVEADVHCEQEMAVKEM
uniref:Programmed cell death 1 ligand 1-like isoform X2 n=1 Tax=Geotrypetes seraphini TaxID=260995 RepID=A0A6P8NYI6_GEOSA|nr:programmed cell death 1 ligand 1-like isoform X2 [Geotrypetes seraphini]